MNKLLKQPNPKNEKRIRSKMKDGNFQNITNQLNNPLKNFYLENLFQKLKSTNLVAVAVVTKNLIPNIINQFKKQVYLKILLLIQTQVCNM